MTTVVEVVINARPEAWREVGFHFESGLLLAGDCAVRIIDDPHRRGIDRWILHGAPQPESQIDGLATQHVDEIPVHSRGFSHGTIVVAGLDHLVVNTPDLTRTSATIQRVTGAPCQRVRSAGDSMQQGFHRLGSVIVEVVTTPQVPQGPARFWGLVFVVDDLAGHAQRLGPDVLGAPKPAVQPGREIATFRSQAGLGVPCALMTREK